MHIFVKHPNYRQIFDHRPVFKVPDSRETNPVSEFLLRLKPGDAIHTKIGYIMTATGTDSEKHAKINTMMKKTLNQSMLASQGILVSINDQNGEALEKIKQDFITHFHQLAERDQGLKIDIVDAMRARERGRILKGMGQLEKLQKSSEWPVDFDNQPIEALQNHFEEQGEQLFHEKNLTLNRSDALRILETNNDIFTQWRDTIKTLVPLHPSASDSQLEKAMRFQTAQRPQEATDKPRKKVHFENLSEPQREPSADSLSDAFDNIDENQRRQIFPRPFPEAPLKSIKPWVWEVTEEQYIVTPTETFWIFKLPPSESPA